MDHEATELFQGDLDEREKALEEMEKRYAEKHNFKLLDEAAEAIVRAREVHQTYLRNTEREKEVEAIVSPADKKSTDEWLQRLLLKSSLQRQRKEALKLEFNTIVQKTETFRNKLMNKVHNACEDKRDNWNQAKSLKKTLETRILETEAKWLDKLQSQAGRSDDNREKGLKPSVSTQIESVGFKREDGSGDGAGIIGNSELVVSTQQQKLMTIGKHVQIPLNQPTDLSSLCLDSIEDMNSPWTALTRKGWHISNLNKMLNKTTTVEVLNAKFVVSLTVDDVENVDVSDEPCNMTGTGNTPNEAFKSALGTAMMKVESVKVSMESHGQRP